MGVKAHVHVKIILYRQDNMEYTSLLLYVKYLTKQHRTQGPRILTGGKTLAVAGDVSQ